MSATFEVRHSTTYEYDSPVPVSHHLLRLTPRALPGQKLLAHEVNVTPAPAVRSGHDDYFGNRTLFLTVEGAHKSLVITASSRVTVTAESQPAPEDSMPWETVGRTGLEPDPRHVQEIADFLHPSAYVPSLPEARAYAEDSFAPGRPVLSAAMDLMHRLHRDFRFDPRATTVATPLAQVFRERRGVCQDFAHAQLACLRSHGLPARYVSGYLETLPPPGEEKLVGADASHAWVQVWCGALGWIGLDPTNDVIPGERHILLGWGRDFDDVSPWKGVIVGSGGHRLKVAVDVTRQHPD